MSDCGGALGDIPEVHQLVTQLPFSAIVTTNYDKLLERAYSRFQGELPKVVTSRERESLGSLLFNGSFFILKAHGDIDDVSSLVLTARDYRDIIHANAAFNALFSALLMTRSLLIVGYSLSDPDFRLLLDCQLSTFGDNIPERYAVMAGVGSVEADVPNGRPTSGCWTIPRDSMPSSRRFFAHLPDVWCPMPGPSLRLLAPDHKHRLEKRATPPPRLREGQRLPNRRRRNRPRCFRPRAVRQLTCRSCFLASGFF